MLFWDFVKHADLPQAGFLEYPPGGDVVRVYEAIDAPELHLAEAVIKHGLCRLGAVTVVPFAVGKAIKNFSYAAVKVGRAKAAKADDLWAAGLGDGKEEAEPPGPFPLFVIEQAGKAKKSRASCSPRQRSSGSKGEFAGSERSSIISSKSAGRKQRRVRCSVSMTVSLLR